MDIKISEPDLFCKIVGGNQRIMPAINHQNRVSITIRQLELVLFYFVQKFSVI